MRGRSVSGLCRLWVSPLWFALAVLLTFAGCGGSTGSGQANGGSPGPGGGSAAGVSLKAPKFVYSLLIGVLGPGGVGPAVAAFRMDPNSGSLSELPSAALPPINSSVGGMAATPQTAFVYVAEWLNKTIVVLRADASSGALTQSTVISVPELVSPPSMITDPAGRFLYAADPNGFQILAFSIQPSGDLSPVAGSPFKLSSPPTSLTMDASGKFLFASSDNQVFGFNVGSDGALTSTPGSPVTVRPVFITPGKGPTGLTAVLDPAANFLFVADATAPQMFVYAVDSAGRLSPASGSPFATGVAGTAAAVTPQGTFVFVGGFGSAQVASLAVNRTTGAVTSVSGSPFDNGPFRNGGAPISDAKVDPSGNFLLLADFDTANVTVFRIDQSSGGLSNVNGSPFKVASQTSVVAVTH